MTEGEYNRVSNLVRVCDAIVIVEKLDPDYGVTHTEKMSLLIQLDTIHKRLSKSIKTVEVKDGDR